MKTKQKGNWLVLVSSGLFGLMAVNARIAYDGGAKTVFVLIMRFALAALLLWLYGLTPARRGKLAVTGEQLKLLFILGGVAHYAISILYFAAISFIPVSLAAVILYIYPVIVNLFMAMVQKERMSIMQLGILTAATAGSILMMWTPGANVDWRGIVLAFGATISNSVYIILLGSKYARKLDGLDSITVNTYIVSFSALSMIITGMLTGGLNFNVTPKGWAAVLMIAVISSGIAPLLFYMGVRTIGPSKASILSTFEPVVTVISGIAVLRETIMFSQAMGMAMVLISVLMMTRAEAAGKLRLQRQ